MLKVVVGSCRLNICQGRDNRRVIFVFSKLLTNQLILIFAIPKVNNFGGVKINIELIFALPYLLPRRKLKQHNGRVQN